MILYLNYINVIMLCHVGDIFLFSISRLKIILLPINEQIQKVYQFFIHSVIICTNSVHIGCIMCIETLL